MAVSRDTAVVGAHRESAGGSNAGAAYIFQRDEGGAGNWGEVKKLTASNAGAHDAFGLSVALSGDTAVVGAMREDSGATDTGAAYVFQRDEGGADNWGEVKKLTASDRQAVDLFGISVAISGDAAIVGAALEDGGGSQAGAAYVFGRDQGGVDRWGEVNKLRASDGQGTDEDGFSVAVSGSIALMGAHGEDTAGSAAGAAYVFDLLLPKPQPTLCLFECVGGVAELPDVAGTPLEVEGSAGPSATVVAGVVAAVTAGAVALGGAAWSARRRRSR